jgi:GLPGLI family protein
MKKKFIGLFFFFFLGQCLAQQDSIQMIAVQYNYVVRGNATKQVTFKADYDMIVVPDHQVSIYDEKVENENLKERPTNDGIINWKPKGRNLETVYKNYGTNEMFLKDNIDMRFFVQKDSLNIFNWEIKEQTKIILGYSCQLAITSFRGRSYEAWFTAVLPDAGPWKFGNLPGLILAVKSSDEYVSWEAVGMSVKNVSSEFKMPENPFQLDKFLTWSEFKALYKQKAIAASKYATEKGPGFSIITPRMQIQRYIEDSDTDYTADKEFEKEENSKK